MVDLLLQLFDTSGFPARWFCGEWSSLHGWTHVLADLAIFGAYAAIPLSIATYVLVKKQELEFSRLYWLFAGFILSCGLTHLVEATIFWHPWYRFSALVKVITAVVSWATVLVLIRALPVAMQLPGTARLNQRLSEEVKERKQSEAALQESSTRLELAMKHAGLGDWSWEAGSPVCRMSERAAEIVGLGSQETRAWDALLQSIAERHRGRVVESFQRGFGEGSLVDEEFVFHKADAGEIWLSVKGRRIANEEGPPLRMIGTVADISERKAAEVERERLFTRERQAREEAEAANRMKDEFLAVLSHELRSPLNAILGWAQILKEESGRSELETGLEVIERNTLAQARLVEDLLDMSRVTSGKIALDLQPVDVRTALNTAEEAILPTAAKKSLQLICQTDPDVGAVLGDPARLQQVLWNLLTNAVKFTPAGGRVELSATRMEGAVEIVVKDNGEGITADFLPHIFDRFRQADSSATRRHGGLGLGLSLVKTLVERHGGSIHAESEGPGRGATFRMRLPVAAGNAELPPLDGGMLDPVGRSSAQSLAGVRVLVVEDELENGEMLSYFFRGHGAGVVLVGNGSAGLAELERGRFDVIVSDLGMPGMDGIGFIGEVRAREAEGGPQVPAIALTAFARPEDRRKAIQAGFDTFLTKPVDMEELLAAVRRHSARGRGGS